MLPGKDASEGRYCAHSEPRSLANSALPGAFVRSAIHPFAIAEALLLTAESKSEPILKMTLSSTLHAGMRAMSALLVKNDIALGPLCRKEMTRDARLADPLSSLILKSARRTHGLPKGIEEGFSCSPHVASTPRQSVFDP